MSRTTRSQNRQNTSGLTPPDTGRSNESSTNPPFSIPSGSSLPSDQFFAQCFRATWLAMCDTTSNHPGGGGGGSSTNQNDDNTGNASPPAKRFHAGADVVPTFDPSDPNADSTKWCRHVDQLAKIYHWSDSMTSYYATTRLLGLAETWRKGMEDIEYTWPQWKEMLIETFPSQKDAASLVGAMMSRKKLPDESYLTYHHEKLALIKACQADDCIITGRSAVSFIVAGISDPIVGGGARSRQFATPEALYLFLLAHSNASSDTSATTTKPAAQKSKGSSESRSITCHRCQKRGHLARDCRQSAPTMTTRSSISSVTCHKCGKTGHYANTCRQPPQKPDQCNYCKRIGHVEADCRTKQRKTAEKIN